MPRTHRRLPATSPSPGSGGPAVAAPAPPARRPTTTARFAEVAGGTTAGCAAICCCFPCGLLSLLVFTVVRLPAGLCRKALRRRRLKRRAACGSSSKKTMLFSLNDEDRAVMKASALAAAEGWPVRQPAAEAEEMERKMWAEFRGAGFWRSSSQRDERIVTSRRIDRWCDFNGCQPQLMAEGAGRNDIRQMPRQGEDCEG